MITPGMVKAVPGIFFASGQSPVDLAFWTENSAEWMAADGFSFRAESQNKKPCICS
jgi:hypothetical protein